MRNQDVVESVAPTEPVLSSGGKARLLLLAFLIVVAAEAIGKVTIPLGKSSIILLPLVWALLIGAGLGLAGKRLPAFARVTPALQYGAASILQFALLLFIAKLGLLVGSSLPKLLGAGWALVFQEFGHFFGTMAFGLPLALLLGIKREAIGATFSVGREPSLAIIGERFGMASPEGRGVLAEYLTGTVFGAIFIALFAGLIASLHIFNPLALAMGAGVGSGSMMAAASGAIAGQETPDVAKDIATFAAASNLVTTTIGTYFTLFLSLPFTIWFYGKLEPILSRGKRAVAEAAPVDFGASGVEAAPDPGIWELLLIWLVVGSFSLVGNWLSYATAPDAAVMAGALIIVGVVAVGYGLYRLTKRKVPAVIWVSLIGMALTCPGVPFASTVAAMTGKINFLALVTPMLAFAGLSMAKDMPAFRQLGWRIVLVSFVANGGTFLGATLIAQFFMHASV